MLDNVAGEIPRNKKWSRKEAISNYRTKSFWKLDEVHILLIEYPILVFRLRYMVMHVSVLLNGDVKVEYFK